MSEWDKDPEVQEWMRDVVENMVPKLEDSAITLSLCPVGEGDPKYWVVHDAIERVLGALS